MMCIYKSGNAIDDDGVSNISELLQKNTTLTSLDIDGMWINRLLKYK